MTRGRQAVVLALLAAAQCLGGCARRTDAATREAWGDRSKGPAGGDGPDAATGDGGEGRDDDPTDAPLLFGWERVDQLVDEGIDLMRHSPDAETMAEVAEQWCAVEPEARQTADGPVYVCFPTPPLKVEGARISLEMGAPGVIGLVVRDVPAKTADALEALARKRVASRCTGPWTDAQSDRAPAVDRTQRFRTCPVGGGPLLAIGRFALDASADRWQVSVAIVGAS